MEKPVIAKVNGDAIGFGSSLAFCADLIVADETARFVDHHMGVGDVPGAERPWSVPPGDGGLALVPMFMSPARAKEYLMLAREFTGKELDRLGIINYAVPAAELDATVGRLTQSLLRRGAHSLAWTKRVANRALAHHLNMTLDASVGYEMVAFTQLMGEGGQSSVLADEK
jgi:enoyl-CoA hydratase